LKNQIEILRTKYPEFYIITELIEVWLTNGKYCRTVYSIGVSPCLLCIWTVYTEVHGQCLYWFL